MTPGQRWNALKEHWRFKYGPPVVDWLIAASAWQAKRKLPRPPMIVLIDTNVLGHGVTHETGWISTGTKKWGPHDIDTGYAARIAVHAPGVKSREYANIQYLPGIAHLARKGLIALKTSAELQDEQWRQPGGRFRGYGSFDYGIFNDVPMESIDGHRFPTMGPSYLDLPTPKDQQQERIKNAADPLYEALVKRLGPKNNLDAWHIATAERHGAFCLLTMDFRLRKAVDDQGHLEPFRSLKTKVMTPLEFGQLFALQPIPPHILGYHRASFPVRADLNWPDSRRRPLKSYKGK